MAMKYLIAQPAETRFLWELEVLLTNLSGFLDSTDDIVIIFDQQNQEAVKRFGTKYGISTHCYTDERVRLGYPPSVRTYLIWRYLAEDKAREREDYFLVDSDIIFRELPEVAGLLPATLRSRLKAARNDEKVAVGSDCEGYLGYDYLITRKNGQQIVQGFADILNIPLELIKNTPGAGAQWVISQPTADLFWHIWQDGDNLYEFLKGVDSDIQRWTAEMWSQLYNLAKYGWKVGIDKELDFAMATDPIKLWDSVKILHNAGVTGVDARALFYKGAYLTRAPFEDDLTWVRKDHCSWRYVEAIKKVVDFSKSL